ncbi:MAG: type II secretion system F family protein [Elusimicrobia bacterium]|nr:type II secretion system F family protein [Elusimicrobiota bacterium]
MISDEGLLDFCRALADAVRSGLPLGEALEILAKSSSQGRALRGAAKLTAGGRPLHEALQAQKIFPPVFIALVRAGEESGKVDEFLDRFADCLEVRVDFRRRLQRAFMYPAFTVLLAAGVFLFLSLKAVPMIIEPLLSAGVAPPRALWLQSLSEYLSEHWQVILVLLIAAGLALRALARSGPARKLWALAGHWLPVFRFAAVHSRLHQICTTMGLLLKAGIPFGTMMDVLGQFFQDDSVTRRHFSRASALLSKGGTFCESVGGCLPPDDRRSLEIAEKSGRLDEALIRLGKTHYDLHSHRMKLLATGFKISATVALAPLCFGLIMALLWPVLSSLSAVKGFIADPRSFGSAPAGDREPSLSGVQGRSGAGSHGGKGSGWSRFNESRAKEIVDFMYKHAPSRGGAGGGEWKKPKLGPMPPMKGVQLRKIQPTSVQSSDFSGSGKFRN